MNNGRKNAVRSLIAESDKVYNTYSPNEDIPTFGNTVETYAPAANQWKYINMYFAKYVGCWRWVRRTLQLSADGPLYSVGAGPCLCVFGWFYDRPPAEGQTTVALDILPWNTIRSHQTFQQLLADVLGGRSHFTYKDYRFFPPQRPPQTIVSGGSNAARAICSTEFPEDAIVILPFVMNHLVGATMPHPQSATVFSWLEDVRRRVRRIVLVDMQHDAKTEKFWNQITQGLGLGDAGGYRTFDFSAEMREFSDCYSSEFQGQRRTGIKFPQLCRASGMVGERSGWRWLP